MALEVMQKISEVVTAQAAREVKWSGLAIARGFEINGMWANGSDAYQELRLYINGEVNDAIWQRQGWAVFGTSVGAGLASKSEVASAAGSGVTMFRANGLIANGRVMVDVREMRNGAHRRYTLVSSQTISSVTDIELICTVAGGIGVNSVFDLAVLRFPVTVGSDVVSTYVTMPEESAADRPV